MSLRFSFSSLAVLHLTRCAFNSERRAQESGESTGAVEQVADAYILVEAVLIVVVVDERNDHERNGQRIDERLGWHRSAHHADTHDFRRNTVLCKSLRQGSRRPGSDVCIEGCKGGPATAQQDE